MRRPFLVPVLLLALLAAVPAATAHEHEEADESAWVEEALEECEGVPLCEDEALEEVEEAEAEGSEGRYPAECVLRSAKAHAVLAKNKLKLTIGYTTSEPTKAKIHLRYGAASLGSVRRHLRLSGVIRVSTKLKSKPGIGRSALRIELDPEGVGCPSRRLVLFPK